METAPEAVPSGQSDPSRDDLLAGLVRALRRLDRLIESAVSAMTAAYGEPVSDPFRGLHIGPEDVRSLLELEPAEPVLWKAAEDADDPPFPRLAAAFGLGPFEVDVLLLCLAPEVDLRYERLYAYLQDDITRRRPTVDLALHLLCSSASQRLARRAAFAPDAPLVRHGLLHVSPDPAQFAPPLLAHFLVPDRQVVRYLLGERALDERLASFCGLRLPSGSIPDSPEDADGALAAQVRDARRRRVPLRLYFRGPAGVGKRAAAETLARQAGAPLLTAELDRLTAQGTEADATLRILFREAEWTDAVLYLAGVDMLRGGEAAGRYGSLLRHLAAHPGTVVLAGELPWNPAAEAPTGVVSVEFEVPDAGARHREWLRRLGDKGVRVADGGVDAVAARFRLARVQIAEAALTACNRARLRAETDDGAEVTAADLFAAARAQSGHHLSSLARKVEPRNGWRDLVLPDDCMAQLRDVCRRVEFRDRVLGEWGFGRKLHIGKGVTVLFAGPSGTGKTMAAGVLAAELGLDLYQIDLSGVVSKYIGETEKNLDRIFRAAEDANAILFFDEADALFGKRSEVQDSHDRYANIEVAYLLQKMEQYDGLAILATNLRQNLDDSFTRRLAATVNFPFPDEASRRSIWEGIWPEEIPLADDVDAGVLASRFKLSGGSIKNIVLAAAFLAAQDGGRVTMLHVLGAVQREYQKLGKSLSSVELYGPPVSLPARS